ncbi:DNA mismatch repair protein MutL [Serendipita vermifera]|nr:DNA mismatch repair protein MutL [Serendipita vermifera]
MSTDIQTAVIKRLEESLINRIAAGEIIHRPSSALKELLENALDAGATSIKITAKDGGLKLLQIQDNGSGIRKADLPILCERFTTSKLTAFEDLSALTTYGFRGEALASISHVAHLSVVTKTRTDSCAWRACYADGVLVPPKPGLTADPKPCAGNDGTLLTVEDLFYNTPTRLAALRSSSDEYKRILDVVTQYAVHNPTISFQCKKVGQAQSDVSTPGGSTVHQAIGLLYGSSLSKDLVHVAIDKQKEKETPWTAEAYISNPNHQSKRFTFLLFINHRLVDSLRMKRAIEAVYTGILPKGASPFVYLSLLLDPKDVDPNVHPTKREVHFLNEEAITQTIADYMQTSLTKEGTSRTFQTQTLLTGGTLDTSTPQRPSKRRKLDDENEEEIAPEAPRKVYSQYKVRTSLQDRTLDSWIPVTQNESSENAQPVTHVKEIKESECSLTSVGELRAEVLDNRHRGFAEILEKHIFVGIADCKLCLSLLQCDTKLYLVNHAALAEEFFYQIGLRQFGNMHKIKLEPAPPLRELIKLAVAADPEFSESGMAIDEGADTIAQILVDRAEMLEEYFAIKIDDKGLVQEIPMLLRDYKPNLDKLPLFLMRLGPQVQWDSEKGCMSSFLRELAYFYTPDTQRSPSRDDSGDSGGDSGMDGAEKAARWQIQHILFPAMRKYFVPPKSLLDREVVQIANLPDLYRVFERC